MNIKSLHKFIIALLSFLVMIVSIGGGFILLKYDVDVPVLAYVGAIAGVVGIVASVSAFSSWRRERRR